MFEHLTGYGFSQILVSGPQRAGTRICGKIIAADTGYNFVDEMDVVTVRGMVNRMMQKGNVIQCPGFARFIHIFARERVLVVWMRRPTAEIIASQERVEWTDEPTERWLYADAYGDQYSDWPICEIKKHYWNQVQKPQIANWLEVDYADLANHRLWIDPEKRVDFQWNQTEM